MVRKICMRLRQEKIWIDNVKMMNAAGFQIPIFFPSWVEITIKISALLFRCRVRGE